MTTRSPPAGVAPRNRTELAEAAEEFGEPRSMTRPFGFGFSFGEGTEYVNV